MTATTPKALTVARDRLRQDDGYTLMEVLLVVLIVGLLAVIMTSNFSGDRAATRDADTKTSLRQAAFASEAISADRLGESGLSAEFFTTSAFSDQGFEARTGQTFYIMGDPLSGYCIAGQNTKGNANGDLGGGWFWWDSTTGGLAATSPTMATPEVGNCTSAFYIMHGGWGALTG